jgi:hypothetical protein
MIITASVQLENEITGRESQGACRQDELISGPRADVDDAKKRQNIKLFP